MRAFSIDDLRLRTGIIEDAARQEPVAINDEGEEFVLMTRKTFERLSEALPVGMDAVGHIPASPYRKAFRIDELPDDLFEELMSGLERAAKAPYEVD